MKLKNCPFCGNQAGIKDATSLRKTLYLVCCNSANCVGESIGRTPDEAVANWNRRPIEDALAGALRSIENDAGHIQETIWAMRNAALAMVEGET